MTRSRSRRWPTRCGSRSRRPPRARLGGGAARRISETRQKVNHHVKALLDVGLVRLVGERRSGNFVEQLYQAVAGTFIVSPRLACAGERRLEALSSQVPLEHLVGLGERVQRDPSSCSTEPRSTVRTSRASRSRPTCASSTPKRGRRSCGSTWSC